jgi:PAS domain S-box-containing protein
MQVDHGAPTTPDLDARFRAMVEGMPGIVYVQLGGLEDSVSYVSPRITEVLGHPLEPFLTDPASWPAILHPDDYERALAADRLADETGVYACEYRLRDTVGDYHWFRDDAMLRHDADEPYWFGVMVEITEQKAAEHALSELSLRYQNLVEQLPAATYVDRLDDDFTSEYVSPQIEELLGIPAEEFTRLDLWASRLHPDDREAAIEGTRAGAASGEPFRLEYRMIRPDGREIWISDQAATIRDADGAPIAIQGLYADITAQKEREQELEEALVRLEALVEHFPGVVYIEDPFCDLLHYLSPRYEEWFGYTVEERIADPSVWQRLVHPDDRDRSREASERAEATGEDLVLEYRMFARDGRMRWIHDETTLVRNTDGSPRFWLGILLDITERAEAEQRVAEAAARFQNLVEQLPAVTYMDSLATEPTRCIYVSPQIETMLGIRPEEATSEDDWWPRRIHPDDRERAIEAAHGAEARGLPYICEYRMVRTDGRVVWVHDEARLVRDDSGRPRYWQGVFYDITAQKNAEGTAPA